MNENLLLTECPKIWHKHRGTIGYNKLLLPSHVTAAPASYKAAFSFLITRVDVNKQHSRGIKAFVVNYKIIS
jgi:hypothetical protein